ncbi:type I 3-dehydroquinate dehydratase [Oceanobacillus senegalensis]|uniref:type I 3-dehydroquinate dehydratase n=1 Tax=Oceanobacillus senegalensis TaxID=1936063 RepID=UPI000A309C42|nr:type I 3-dehydroquinate dehydratase [Oceanobacillus senegalensis]
MPKICVPMVGKTNEELREEAEYLSKMDIDLVEWRVDFYQDVENVEAVRDASVQIREILGGIPLLFTFRSAKEGGEKEVGLDYYATLNKAMIETKCMDMIDVELFIDEKVMRNLIKVAQHNQVKVIISNHDFEKTPPKEEIVSRLRKAQDLGADIPKIAVMPRNEKDVLTLLEATNEMKNQYAKQPIITMAMAGKGVISRLAGEIFGSAITFGAAKKASAPGQVGVEELKSVLKLIHQNVKEK